jgi:UDP-N-acetylmuramate--alanine ligase
VAEHVYAHFIGAGGAGMSGIALVLHRRGIAVTGSDLKESRYSRLLEREGVPVAIGHAAENLGEPDVVVVSSAIPETNPELAEARRRGMEVWPRAKMLAHLAGERTTIAVAGTHGKTSTSSMIATMLSRMGLDPTFLIGGEVDGFGTNAVAGSGPHYVVEADESDGSFVHLTPQVALVTNVEADHLDHYEGGIEEIEATFADFLQRVPPDGIVVAWTGDARLLEIAAASGRKLVTYGSDDSADVRYEVLAHTDSGTTFTATTPSGETAECLCPVPGEHMVANAAGALAVAWALGLPLADACTALSSFTGVRRRFDLVATVEGVTIVDDYAHHPTEVKATVKAARALGRYGRIWVLFQPHRYSRTAALAGDFGEAFDEADRVVLMDVYSAGETPIPGVNGKTLVESILRHNGRARVTWLPHRADVAEYLSSQVRSGDLVLTMGAGDVTALGPEIVRVLSERSGEQSCP